MNNLNEVPVYSVFSTSRENTKKRLDITELDLVLNLVKKYVLSGWPKFKKDVPIRVRAYLHIKDEIYLNDLFYKKRIIVRML